jgi:thiol-disulfide isomerase/thioredoxin
MKNAVFVLVIFAILILFFPAGCGSRCSKEKSQQGALFPSFKAKGTDGKDYSEANIENGPAVVAFFVSWCKPCANEISALGKINREYTERGLIVLVFTYEDPAKFKHILDSLGTNLVVLQADSAVFAQLQIDAIPTRILLSNRHEQIRIVGANNGREEAFLQALDELMKSAKKKK